MYKLLYIERGLAGDCGSLLGEGTLMRVLVLAESYRISRRITSLHQMSLYVCVT